MSGLSTGHMNSSHTHISLSWSTRKASGTEYGELSCPRQRYRLIGLSICLASCHSPAWPLSTAIYSSSPADGAPYLSFQALRASGAVRDIPAKNRATEGSKTPELPCLKMCLARGSAAGNRRLLGALRAYELGERKDSNTEFASLSPLG